VNASHNAATKVACSRCVRGAPRGLRCFHLRRTRAKIHVGGGCEFVSPIATSCMVLACVFGGALLGMVLRNFLP